MLLYSVTTNILLYVPNVDNPPTTSMPPTNDPVSTPTVPTSDKQQHDQESHVPTDHTKVSDDVSFLIQTIYNMHIFYYAYKLPFIQISVVSIIDCPWERLQKSYSYG
jgi:hypothetical protein